MLMTDKEIAISVTIEQIATAIKQMSNSELVALLRLVPELKGNTMSKKNSPTQARSYNFARARTVLKHVKGNLSETVVGERDERG